MSKMKSITFRMMLCGFCCLSTAGSQPRPHEFTHADTLRGTYSPERACYDLTYYHLDVKINPDSQSIEGSNDIWFTVLTPFNTMQIDLFKNLAITRIVLDEGRSAAFRRDGNAVFVTTDKRLPTGSRHHIKVYYGGKPTVAANPPWQGGFIWTKDSVGRPWIAVTCQGLGASVWWPNKDHQADESDSMLLSVTVPGGLTDISNGRLRATTNLPGGWTKYDWFISHPINNYNVTVNVGTYSCFSDVYGTDPMLTLDYYVLPQNLEKAKKQFEQVKTMLGAFEHYFGKYPFPRDGYKLVECPHTGMEHQSAVAYGNRYLGGYRGRAPSEAGLKFDFIIVHESAHEWWGNAVTAKDAADMWIHESFGAYAEALYVEHMWGYRESLRYINGKKPNVRNQEPIIGIYNVQHEGAGDMYDKGQLALNTLRSVIDNDSLWIATLRGMYEAFRYKTIGAEDVFGFVNKSTGRDFGYFFDQYLKRASIPQLEVTLRIKGDSTSMRYRWNAEVKEFRMPVRVTTAPGNYEFITPTIDWQQMKVGNIRPEDFKVEEDRFYIDLRLSWSYLDKRLEDSRGSGRSSWF